MFFCSAKKNRKIYNKTTKKHLRHSQFHFLVKFFDGFFLFFFYLLVCLFPISSSFSKQIWFSKETKKVHYKIVTDFNDSNSIKQLLFICRSKQSRKKKTAFLSMIKQNQNEYTKSYFSFHSIHTFFLFSIYSDFTCFFFPFSIHVIFIIIQAKIGQKKRTTNSVKKFFKHKFVWWKKVEKKDKNGKKKAMHKKTT